MAFYHLNKELDKAKFKERVNHLFKKEAKVELKISRKARTSNQNSYLHVILNAYGLELGYTLDEVKQEIFKRNICKDFFAIKKNGLTFFRSTKDLDTLEMTNAIEKFRNHASKDLGIYLPQPNEEELLEQLEEESKRFGNRQYT